MDENASEPEGGETITDIQNYLASFNKEIQDGGTAGSSTAAAALESTTEGTAAEGSTETAFFVAAPGTAAGEGFQFEQAEAPFGTTYYTSSDGTYYATTTGDPNQASTLAFATQADGTTVLPVAGQRTAYRTVSTGDHAGLQQIVLAVSEANSAAGTSGTRQEIVAIPASLAPQAIGNTAQVGDQQAFVAMQATSSHDGQIEETQSVQNQGQLATLVTSDDGGQVDSKSGLSQVQTIRMILRNADGTETEQNVPVSSSRVPTLLTNDGQEVQLSDENQLQMISTIVEQAASSGLADGNNQVILNVGNAYQAVTVVPTNGASGEVSYMFIVAQSDDDKDPTKEMDLDMSVYDFNEGEKHGEIVAEEVAPDGTKTRTIRITQKKSQIVTQAHMCNYCNYTSPKRYLLSRHMKSHSEERPHKCGVCERGFKTLASLQNHVNTHTGTRPHCCRDCDASFTTSGELVRHVRYRHTHEKPHRCTECDYASVELSKLKRHMRCHTGERPYQCPHCTYASPDMYKLKRHLRIHTGEKPYECDVCQARFTQSNSLKAHKLIHSGNKPSFHCDFCPTTCGRKTDLRIHMQKLHTSDKPLKCKRCGKTFPDRYSYKLHSKTHEGEKCFKCDLCPYASISQRHLESHMLIHTDQKPFRCDECDQAFRQKQLLRRHKNLYHDPNYVAPAPKEKTNECSECGKAFRHKGNLIRHLAIHDPEASMAEKEEALRIGEPKGPGEQPDGEEEEVYYMEEEDEEDVDAPPFSGAVTISDQGTVQQTEDGQQVVVFEVIQLHPPASDQPVTELQPAATTSNGETTILPTLQETPEEEEDCYVSAVAEVLGQVAAQQTPASPATPATPARRRGRPRKTPAPATPVTELLKQVKVEEIKEDSVKETPSARGRKRKVTEVAEPPPVEIPVETPKRGGRPLRSCRMRKDDSQNVSEPVSASVVPEEMEDLPESEELARREAEQERRRLEQKQKDMAECFGFNEDEEETETILAMPAVPGSQSMNVMEDGTLLVNLPNHTGT
ncbi:transcriptional repressor CTCF-like [Argiope bruennichi]|uniref:Transcriptional repressor CTCF like protein n=1 Tax=Argiope bruennichi TaxID=94029 RepID=A0A8T0E3A9_ARGBR|nr:transcriptional repressor CTCF-like [Argiope bruennichi]XP_055937902.1 transcriptional repressor CTCF-like [Argiope bruennichi]KAF8764826.1 Transcriptional repressor CTCF like protein [Argiope bruennichi]